MTLLKGLAVGTSWAEPQAGMLTSALPAASAGGEKLDSLALLNKGRTFCLHTRQRRQLHGQHGFAIQCYF